MNRVILVLILLGTSSSLLEGPGIEAITLQTGPDGEKTYSLTLQALALMTVLTLLPAMLLMMTAFTRIVIVLAMLRTALGTAQTPSNQIIIGLALFLTMFVMQPVFSKMYEEGVAPYMNEEMALEPALKAAAAPLRDFMLSQTREDDIALFLSLHGQEVDSAEELPFFILMPAFVTSELKTAFQIAFLIFIPFLIIDLVVASVLMSMGMMMLSPLIISLPFKLMLFVLIDGWSLILGTLASSFYVTVPI